MKAIGYFQSLPIDRADSLLDVDVAEPTPGDFDLLVEVKAISVNPVDTKVRLRAASTDGQPRILGWDAAGVVRAAGPKTGKFRPGDKVWYAGDVTRAGSNSELQLVDERIVGPMPASLDYAAAAALPLTSITAWELLFDRLKVQTADPTRDNTLLVIGAGGGVGSILVQLASKLTGWTIVGTASREATRDWVRGLGAHHVIDHAKPLAQGLQAVGIGQVSAAIGVTHTDDYLAQIPDLLEAEGQFALIDDPKALDVLAFKRKSLSLHWESMFTRSTFRTPQLARQGEILRRIAELVDRGVIRSTVAEHYGTINAANLKRAHALLESGASRGKIVLEGF
ncbi:MAG: zinc-binding alcohol dehydrogenase family protein [Rudaea sp.]|uniref:zinc-binding alcohol dehydrogenase family protein n=1 Tax=Rudaea sp. TaxID=2136325 RepID=UPI0039E4E223